MNHFDIQANQLGLVKTQYVLRESELEIDRTVPAATIAHMTCTDRLPRDNYDVMTAETSGALAQSILDESVRQFHAKVRQQY